MYPAPTGTTSSGCLSHTNTVPEGRKSSDAISARKNVSTKPRWMPRATDSASSAPTACATMGSSAISMPLPKTATV